MIKVLEGNIEMIVDRIGEMNCWRVKFILIAPIHFHFLLNASKSMQPNIWKLHDCTSSSKGHYGICYHQVIDYNRSHRYFLNIYMQLLIFLFTFSGGSCIQKAVRENLISFSKVCDILGNVWYEMAVVWEGFCLLWRYCVLSCTWK